MAKHSILVTIPFLVAIMLASPATAASPASRPTPPAAAPQANSSTSAVLQPASDTPSAYDMLQQYNLSVGILPEGVTGYVLHPDGSFEVNLPSDCNVRAGGLKVQYRSVITGYIQTQSITDLDGVRVKELVWIDITKVSAANGQLKFVAGGITKSFPMDKFLKSPQCN